ncbi:MAG: hypothetical protein QF828_13315 [Pseudomonadales bacterium]|nr:hypothetical protein [Pseudomonadales bacterium]
MPSFQDDEREQMMRELFNLQEVEGRTSTDALFKREDGQVLEFELKSTSSAQRSVTTVRDFGPDHVKKWKNKHWLLICSEN